MLVDIPEVQGFVLFEARTGVLVTERRFVKNFGLPGSKNEPAIADPVGLALQLFAFSKFAGEVSNDFQLSCLGLGDSAGSIYMASTIRSKETDGGDAPLILALFGRLPKELGHMLAEKLLTACLLVPSTKDRLKQFKTSNLGVPLRDALRTGLDSLVFDLASELPLMPAWIVIIYTKVYEEGTYPMKERATTTPATNVVPQRPHGPPPNVHSTAPPLSRRLRDRMHFPRPSSQSRPRS
eukprot:2422160-Amphidinium_carterae.1